MLARMSGGENHGKVWPAHFQLARQIDPVHDAAQPNVGEDHDDLPPTDQHDGKRRFRAFTLVSSCSSSSSDAVRLRSSASSSTIITARRFCCACPMTGLLS